MEINLGFTLLVRSLTNTRFQRVQPASVEKSGDFIHDEMAEMKENGKDTLYIYLLSVDCLSLRDNVTFNKEFHLNNFRNKPI